MGAPRGRRGARAIDGVLLLDKPLGLTSNAALVQARRLLSAAKAGHTGTLDPLATGLLPLCFGEATKFSGFLLGADKTYEAVVALGASTTTGDAEGEVAFQGDPALARDQLDAVLPEFVGRLVQRPPMFSALKHRGRPLYEYARAGQTVERPVREVLVHELTVLARHPDRVHLRVRVSKGTYIRTLAQDLGDRLGCGAHLKALRRIAIGSLRIEQACTLDALQNTPPEDQLTLLRPLDFLVRELPRIELAPALAAAICQGQSVPIDAPEGASGAVALYLSAGKFLGTGEIRAPGRLTPLRLLAVRPPQGP